MTTTTAPASVAAAGTTRQATRAFTLVELLVVIGIIALLIGLLLPALGKVMERARATTTTGTMQEFAKACDAYFQEFGEYPGVIPEDYLYAGNGDTDIPPVSGTENALLALMGGYRLPSDSDYATFAGTELTFSGTGMPTFKIKVNPDRMGEGPTRNGKKYDPFYAPKGREFAKVNGQMQNGGGMDAAGGGMLPDLVDAWGQPILFVKQVRSMGTLVKRSGDPGQFSRAGILPYTLSTALGDYSQDQTTANASKYSILNTTSAGGQSGSIARDLTLGQLIRHPALNVQNAAATDADKVWAGTPRGKYFLVSPGPDGIYFSAAQGYGTTSTPKGDIVSVGQNADGPNVAQRYDDLIVTGGS